MHGSTTEDFRTPRPFAGKIRPDQNGAKAMKIVRAAVVGSFIACCGIGNGAAYFKTGNELKVWCAAEESDPDYILLQAFCTAYIQGVADSIETSLSAGLNERVRCVPDAMAADQLVKIVLDYQAEHLATRHLSASDGVIAALTDAFDCEWRFGPDLN